MQRHTLLALASVLLAVGAGSGLAGGAGATTADRATPQLAPAADPTSAWAQSSYTPQQGNWRPYLLSPSSRLLRPAAVLNADPRSGAIGGDPAAALATDGNTVRLTNNAAGRTGSPLVTFDFGQEVGGKVQVDLTGVSNPAPDLHACFSESQQYMSSLTVESQQYPYAPRCDTANYNNGYSATYTYDSDSHTLTLPSRYPGTATDSQLRGGFRYLTLFLDGAGWVDVDGVALDFTNASHQGPDPSQYAGWFLSSDDLLNKVWYGGAYTVQLNTDSSRTAKSWPYVAGGSTTLARAASTGDTNIKVANAGVFSVDGTATLDSGANVEKAVVAAVGSSAASTQLAGVARPGDTNVKVVSISGLTVGQMLSVGTSALLESRTIAAVGTAGATGTGVTLTSGLANPHAIGEPVTAPGTGITLKSPLALAHASGAAISAPGEIDHADAQVPHADPNADVIFDGAKRDRIVWQGDLSVQVPVALLSTNDVSAVDNSLSSLAAQQQPDGYMPAESLVGPHNFGELRTYGEYVNWFVNNMYAHWLYTGDLAYLQQWWPALQAAVAWIETQRSANGLLAYPSNSGHYGYGDGGHEAYLNALYKRNLDQMAAMASAVGDGTRAVTYADRAQAVAQAINSQLWDSAAGAYWLSTETHGQHPQDGNAMAIIAGVADPTRAAQILDFMHAKNWSTYGSLRVPSSEGNSPISQAYSPLPTGFEAEARLLTPGDAQSALDLIRTYWGYQLAQDPHSTWWEHVTTAGKPSIAQFTSLAHGWGSAPTVLLTEYVLGIVPTDAGYATFRVAPHSGDVGWAQGAVPTPHGAIAADWSKANNRFELELTVPPGTVAEVHVPIVDGQDVREGGGPAAEQQGVKLLSRSASEAVFQVDPGTYDFIATAPVASTTVFTAGSASSGDFNDLASFSALLSDEFGPVVGGGVTFSLANTAQSCTASSDASGVATCSIVPSEPAGQGTVTASFAGSSVDLPSSVSASFVVSREEATLSYTGASGSLVNGSQARLSAVLKEDGQSAIAGRLVSFRLGGGASAQTCTARTDAAGLASCAVTVNQPPGPDVVTAGFAGDGYYLPASDSASATVLFAFAGFFAPVVNPPTLNVVKAGSGVPVRFGLGGNYGLAIFAAGYPQVQAVACEPKAATHTIAAKDTLRLSSSALSYDQKTGRYTYAWATAKNWANSCRRLDLKLSDGSIHSALFKLTK